MFHYGEDMDFSKLTKSSLSEVRSEPTDEITAIFLVKEAGYVPQGVVVRSRVDNTMFTANTTIGCLESLKNDGKIKAIQPSKPLHIIG